MKTACLAGILALTTSIASATTVHDETVNGDLSDDPLAPTALTFGFGANTIFGAVGPGFTVRDYFSFTIAPGLELSSIFLVSYDDLDTAAANDGNTGYHLLDDGTASVIPGGATSGDFLAGNLTLASAVGTDLLFALATSPNGGAGLATSPLGAGTYTFLQQQTGPQNTGYTFTFNVAEVAAVPLPAGGVLYLAGLLLAACATRFRQRQAGMA